MKEEGAFFQGLKDEVRCKRAKELLNRSDEPVKQLAAVGFRNEKSFSQVFWERTGSLGEGCGGVRVRTWDACVSMQFKCVQSGGAEG